MTGFDLKICCFFPPERIWQEYQGYSSYVTCGAEWMCPACLLGWWHRKKCPTDRRKSHRARQTTLLESDVQKIVVPPAKLISIDFHWFSMIFIDFHWFSMIFIDFHWFSLIFIDFHHFYLHVPTSKVSSEASSGTFFDRLDIFPDAINLKITMAVLILALVAF